MKTTKRFATVAAACVLLLSVMTAGVGAADKATDGVTKITPESKAVPVDFKGITSDAETPLTGNLAINRQNYMFPSVFCPNPKNGDIYYTNFKDKSYLYKLSGDESTLLTEKAATNINYIDDVLYFISPTATIKDLPVPGDIYKLDLKTNKCELVHGAKADTLVATKDKLYYTETKFKELGGGARQGTATMYSIPIEGGTPTKCSDAFFVPYKDYTFALNATEQTAALIQNETGKKVNVSSIADLPMTGLCIYGDNLCTGRGEIHILNLKTGAKNIYKLDDYFPLISKVYKSFKPNNNYGMTAHTVIDNILYISYAGVIISIDLDTGDAKASVIDPNLGKKITRGGIGNEYYRLPPSIESLYTDGKRLFALPVQYGGPQSLLEIIIDGGHQTVKELN